MTGIPSSPLSVSKCTDNNITNQPTTGLICIHVYYSRSGFTRNVEHPESAETGTLSPKSNRSGISLAFWALAPPPFAGGTLCLVLHRRSASLSPLRMHRASTLLYLCPVTYSHTLFVLCSIEALTVDSGTCQCTACTLLVHRLHPDSLRNPLIGFGSTSREV